MKLDLGEENLDATSTLPVLSGCTLVQAHASTTLPYKTINSRLEIGVLCYRVTQEEQEACHSHIKMSGGAQEPNKHGRSS